MAITFAIFFLSLACVTSISICALHVIFAIFHKEEGEVEMVEGECVDEMSLLDVLRECEAYDILDAMAVAAVDQRVDALVVSLLKGEVEDDIFRQMVEQECDDEISAALADTQIAPPRVETVILCNGQRIDLHVAPIGQDVTEMDWDLLSEFVSENLDENWGADLSRFDPTSESSLWELFAPTPGNPSFEGM